MANILVRSPRFETFTMLSQGNSIKLELYIGGVLRYTIIKNSAPSSVVTFEIAELTIHRRKWDRIICRR